MLDITASASHKATLADLEVFKLAVESSTNHIVITDSNGVIIYANKAAQETTGFTLEEMQGNTPRLWGGQMSAELYRELWKTIKEERRPYIGQIDNIRKNGEVYTSFARISPIVTSDDRLVGFVGTEEDISRRIILEGKLQQRTDTLAQKTDQDEAILSSIGDGVVAVDVTGKIVLINPAALEMLGYVLPEALGKSYVDIVRAQDESGMDITIEHRAVTRANAENKKRG